MADETALPALDSELSVDELFDVSIDADLLSASSDSDNEPNPYGITWAFDFQKGDIFLDSHGAMAQVSGKETLKQWMGHTLSIARGESSLYSGDIGTRIPFLYGLRVDAAEVLAKIESEVRTALTFHDKIAEIKAVSTFPLGNTLYVYVEYLTDDQDEVSDLIGL